MLAEHDAQGSANTSRGFQGARPSLYDFEDEIRRLSYPGADCGRRRRRPLHRAKPVPESDARRLRAGRVSQDRPCGEPGRARPVQPGCSAIFSSASMPAAGGPRDPRIGAGRRSARAAMEPQVRSSSFKGCEPRGGPAMLKWAVVFLLIAIVAGIFGFTGVARQRRPSSHNSVRHFPGAVHRRPGDRAGDRREADAVNDI